MLLGYKVSKGRGFHGSWKIAGDTVFHSSASFLQKIMQDDLVYVQRLMEFFLM